MGEFGPQSALQKAFDLGSGEAWRSLQQMRAEVVEMR